VYTSYPAEKKAESLADLSSSSMTTLGGRKCQGMTEAVDHHDHHARTTGQGLNGTNLVARAQKSHQAVTVNGRYLLP